MMDFDQARENMIKQQIRTEYVVDESLLDLLKRHPRHQFVPPAYRDLAYADMNIPLGDGTSMMTPAMEALVLNALNVKEGEKVLEIGTGAAYMTALLNDLSNGNVVTLDTTDHVLPEVRKRLGRVTFKEGDARHGWQDLGRFDVIIMNGSVRSVPEGLLDRLYPGGRLFAVVGEEPVMEATLFTRRKDGVIESRGLLETVLPRLPSGGGDALFDF